jgi:hypothetical protein
MEKKCFGDLEKGDLVWIIDTKKWIVRSLEISEICKSARANMIWIYFKDRTSNALVRKDSNYHKGLFGEGIWINQEKSIQALLVKAKMEEYVYIKRIDTLISEYDALQKFIKENGKET